MLIRHERPGDASRIAAVTEAAFAPRERDPETMARIAESLRAAGMDMEALARAAEESSGAAEVAVIDRLRADGALTLSLVGEIAGEVMAHIAFSPMQIGTDKRSWFQLGPVSVIPERQKIGHGSALIRESLRQLQELGAAGCVLLGYPPFYTRFGFELDSQLTYGGNPNPALQRIIFGGPPPRGEIRLHPAFHEA